VTSTASKIAMTRRQLLATTAGLAGAALLGGSASAEAPKTQIAVRVRRDISVIDPAFRTGLEDAQVIQRALR